MFAIATIIDLGEKKIKGFVGDGPRKQKAGFNVEVDGTSDKTKA